MKSGGPQEGKEGFRGLAQIRSRRSTVGVAPFGTSLLSGDEAARDDVFSMCFL